MDKEASIILKLKKAHALLKEVQVLLDHAFYTTAINRLYYSCFHVTKALLLTRDLIPKTHSGVVSALHKSFVQDGYFAFEQASFFSRLMQERIDDDYSDHLIIEGERYSLLWSQPKPMLLT
ncbi:MAG: HEPN domain-containing protein [Candidatus Pseudobacter hemicellulosilyticus]|uniref:HEPN domain-containing protein n=1 Tax=Candidatus Pseudobacter hemicellulosilyticus TaxID=3121375 RepID=A0AAJ6BJQ8_9BACT|nr:MAG: HEPN domain-containing protein [Pseudobacter sp.]